MYLLPLTLALLQAPAPILPTKAGVLVNQTEIMDMAHSGAGWDALMDDANALVASPFVVIANQDDKYDSYTLAAAIAWTATGDEQYRLAVETALLRCIGTEGDDFPGENNSSLELSRNLACLAIAADILEWTIPSEEEAFIEWLSMVRLFERSDGRSIVSTHEDRPNNWGTHAGASRVAIAAYIGDVAEVERCAQILKGWLGDRESYSGFDWGDLSWQVDPGTPVGVNPLGARLDGCPVGGVLPDDQRRCGSWPSSAGCQTNYVYEALQGVVLQAIVLRRAGYDVWRWEDRAIGRAVWWASFWNQQPPDGDDLWQSHVLLAVYPHPRLAELLPLAPVTNPGKAIGYAEVLTSGTLWP